MARASLTLTVVGLPAFVLVGCGGEASSGVTWGGTVDTVEGVVVVTNPAEPMLAGEDAWRLEEELDIGVIEGDPDYQFGSINDVVVDGGGDIYVLDGQARRVMVYDSTGLFVTSFGRQGEGPGEFENPAILFWKADTLAVWDWRQRRLTYFEPDGTLLRDTRVEMPFGFNPKAFLGSGMVLAQLGPVYSMPIQPERDGVGWILSVDLSDASAADTLLRWEAGGTVPVRSGNFMLVNRIVYAPSLEWTADAAGRIYVARGEEYEIEVYTPAGERVRTIRREYTRYPPSPAERDSARAQHERRAERFGANADLYRKSFQIAEAKQATGDVIVSDSGDLWIRVLTEDDQASWAWDLFDSDGRYLTSLETQAGTTIHAIVGGDVYAEVRDELDVPHVKRYTIVRPAEGSGET